MVRWTSFVALHVPLALAERAFPALASIHGWGTAAVGACLALGDRPAKVGYVAAYLATADVLWRMCRSALFWEFGKYACCVLLWVAGARMRATAGSKLPVVFFALLIPSIPMTVLSESDKWREMLSFNLSGPLCLATCYWYFSRIQMDWLDVKRLLVTLVAPVVAVATLAASSTLSASEIVWSARSNLVTSGGFGPNQVSSVLGVAVLALFLALLDPDLPRIRQIFVVVALAFFSVICALTLSRGGLVTAGGAILLASLVYVKRRVTRVRLLGVAVVMAVGAHVIVIPRLDAFTQGTVTERFRDTSTTGRSILFRDELVIFAQHPLVGVGPGRAGALRRSGKAGAAHTEFSRLLAEHGLGGLGAIALMLVMFRRSYRSAPEVRARALVAAFSSWSFLFMLANGMRTVAPGFLFGLTAASIGSARKPRRDA